MRHRGCGPDTCPDTALVPWRPFHSARGDVRNEDPYGRSRIVSCFQLGHALSASQCVVQFTTHALAQNWFSPVRCFLLPR